MVHPLILAFSLSVAIDPAACRQQGTVAARWQADGRAISLSTDARTTGEVTLRCRLPIPPSARFVTLSFDRAHLSFQPAGSKTTGSGLVLRVGDACRAELTRVAGEDWIESLNRRWSVPVPPGMRRIEIILTARDLSPQDALRIDLTGLRLSPGQANNADVCQPVQHELNGDRRQDQTH